MFQAEADTRLVPRWKPAPGVAPELGFVLGRIDRALGGFFPGMVFDPPRLRELLLRVDTGTDPGALFARGWLAWLEGGFAEAEEALARLAACTDPAGPDALARGAYWLARVRLLRESPQALAGYEAVLRQLRGSPQGTVWFVDLLWRGGQLDRAEQVWKSVRAGRKVVACDEWPLLEARMLLWRGDTGAAEKLLQEARPGSGVVQAERLLLLAWVAAARRQGEQARALLDQARRHPYPRAAVDAWSSLLEARLQPAGETADQSPGPFPSLRALFRGIEARLGGKLDEAVTCFEEARALPASRPWARYLLALLGRDNPLEAFAAPTNLFLAVRCRALLALERFRLRQGAPEAWLETLHQQEAHGFPASPAVEHFRSLALLLRNPPADPAALRERFERAAGLPAGERSNTLQALVELAARLPADAARSLLHEWLPREEVQADARLQALVREHIIRLALGQALAGGCVTGDEAQGALAAADEVLSASAGQKPGQELLRACRQLADGYEPSEREGWTGRVSSLREHPTLGGLAQALLVQEAACHQDLAAVCAGLGETRRWQGLKAPPRFLVQTLLRLGATHPHHPGWKEALSSWLALWRGLDQGEDLRPLALLAGEAAGSPSQLAPPPGVARGPWLLHQASRAVRMEDYQDALLCVRAALEAGPGRDGLAALDQARQALPDLERLAQAQALVRIWLPAAARPAPAAVVNLVDLLRQLPGGDPLHAAVETGQEGELWQRLAELLDRPELPVALLHHLALLQMRRGEALQEEGRWEEALSAWELSWKAWLRYLAQRLATGDPSVAADQDLLLSHLLDRLRGNVHDLLSRGLVDTARRHWALARQLSPLATPWSEPLAGHLEGRFRQLRDDLTAGYLTATREAMRYGEVPEGWHADYEKGLGFLRRFLSLERDSIPLLTALLEIWNEWLLDLYNNEDPQGLATQVDRSTPFALQLARLVENRPGELAARAALAELYKFRGFMAGDPREKRAHYEEALRLDPANENVRELLGALDEPEGAAS